jgi:hypothetical protein
VVVVVAPGDDLSTFILVTVTEVGHTKAVGDLVRLTTGVPAWVDAQADSAATLDDGTVYDVPTADSFRVLISDGVLPWTGHGLGSAGANLYLSRSSAGDHTATAGSGGEIERYVGFVLDANTIVRQVGHPQWVV